MILLIISIPFLSSLSILLLGLKIGQKGSVIISVISILSSMILSIKLLSSYILYNNEIIIPLFHWVNLGLLNISFHIYLDKFSILMVFLISTITFVVTSFSTWYMFEDPHKNRFLSYLLMFSVAMLMLVCSFNFLTMFVAWEAVGFMSYLLINYWYNSVNSNKSAIKAILYNKVGDIGFLIAMSILYLQSGATHITNLGDNQINLVVICFLMASIAKSAQIILHCWLGDAMAGPTPVSALLHAATMVTAGVFLLYRCGDNYPAYINNIIIIIGLFTILFGGLSSINQNDIKKIIAYSTCSQLGYMFLTSGVGVSNLGMFHLLTHGFFKALLFLTAGLLIHNCHHEQDVRKWGSLIFSSPLAYLFFLLGSLSIVSFPFLSGFYSKEPLITNTFIGLPVIYMFMVIGALFTSIYSFKLLYFTFFSSPNFTKPKNIASPQQEMFGVYLIPTMGSIFVGYFFNDVLIQPGVLGDSEYIPAYIKLIPLCAALLGVMGAMMKGGHPQILTIFNKRFFFDSIINHIFASNILNWGYNYTYKFLDKGVLELFGPVGLVHLRKSFGFSQPNSMNLNGVVYLFMSFASLLAVGHIL